MKNLMMEKKRANTAVFNQLMDNIFVVILALYPLRHIHWGLDLWDTGYNYANFEYMGMEHMDSMWLFSTYLANAVGHLITFLPKADNLVGMNFYTGLFAGALALIGYFFCTRKLTMPKWIAFLGEFAALSLCWCPTALIYNYLTYLLFLGCIILLYMGLIKDKMWYLFAAGVCLGTNVLVRFSNLPEAAMIVAVWAYVFIVSRERKKAGVPMGKGCGAWNLGFRYTLWCLGGYLSALVLLFGYIQLRYGMGEYLAGIQRLFAMTDNATDYKPTAMIMGVVGTYVENLYWVIRIFVIIAAGMVVSMIAESTSRYCNPITERKGLCKFLKWGSIVFSVVLGLATLYWLYARGFCSLFFYSYDPMRRPAILFMMLAMLIGGIRIVHPHVPKEEKLLSGMLILVILLTSIGSNNEVYPSMNNLFLVAPYTLWQCFRFCKNVKEWVVKKLVISAFPAKCVLGAFIALFFFQITMFGVYFSFVEATGAQNVTVMVENNEILKGIKMSPERAQWMTEITEYVTEHDLQGREVIPYGNIPAVAYYLEMPPAFNHWSDLDSYSMEQMKLDLSEVAMDMAASAEQRPLIIIERKYAEYLSGGVEALEKIGVGEVEIAEMESDEKWKLLVTFMQEYGFERTFSNDKFVMWE